MVMCAYTKSLSKQGIQKKLFTRIFNCLNTYIHTERRNFKTFPKENYTIGLIVCYLLNFEHGAEHDIDSAYGWSLHELDSLLVCNITRFLFNRLLGGKFVT